MAMGLSMYGFADIVVDVCGTQGPLDEELCARWMQLGAFLPMVRNNWQQYSIDPVSKEQIKT